MKSILLWLVACCCCSLPALAGRAPVSVLSQTATQTVLQLYTNTNYQLHPVSTPRGTAYTLTAPNATPLQKAGAPDLPKISTAISIPYTGSSHLRVLSADYTDVPHVLLAPSKGNLLRNINPANIAFAYSEVYEQNSFFPAQTAALRQPYLLRDQRAQTVVWYPYQYNPVTQVLRIYHQITLAVDYLPHTLGINEMPAWAAQHQRTSADFEAIYARQLVNYTPAAERYDALSDAAPRLLIITPSIFRDIIQPLVDWKIRRGIATQVVDIADIGDQNALRQYIANQYQNNQITHVLLVGDAEQIPSLYSDLAQGYSDVQYGCILGNDSYPEVFIGRFSGTNTDHIRTQVQRTINYEVTPNTSNDWLSTAACIASAEGPGDDGEMDWEHQRNIRTDLLAYTYTTGHELYDGSQGGADAAGSPSAAALVDIINNGVGMLSYTGHGYEGGCATTGLDISDVLTLENMGKLPFFWSVACVNGAFVDGTCFAESLLRSENNGQAIGCVATLMSTINQSWNPPMAGQDEMVDILTEQYDSKLMRSFGGISYNGCMKMNDDYGNDGQAMTDSWTCFGDPTLMVRTTTPQALTAQHNAALVLGSSTLQVSAAVEGAAVALVVDGQILAVGTITGGSCLLSFAPLTNIGTMYVTLTAFNYTPYLGQADIVPGTTPYVVAQNAQLLDTNANNIAENGEAVQLTVSLHNLGPVATNGITATLSTNSPYITITDNTQTIDALAGEQSLDFASAFAFNIAADIPDQQVVSFTISVTDQDGNTWLSYLNYTIAAPKLVANTVLVDDSFGGNNNGRLDPGETVIVTLPTFNNGHAATVSGEGNLNTTTASIMLSNNNVALEALTPNQAAQPAFAITAAADIAVGSYAQLFYSANAGAYNTQFAFNLPVGLIVEDFESGGFASFSWSNGGNQPWVTDPANAYEGSESAKSGSIGDGEVSVLELSRNLAFADSVSFFKRVSSEQDWDYLRFYIDGVERGAWSGNVEWSRVAYAVPAGEHSFRWTYAKDEYYSDGADAAWVDFVVLPANAVQCSANAGTISLPSNTEWHANETLSVTATNYNTDLQQWYLIVQAAEPHNIVAINQTANFVLTMGDYMVYALNADPSFTPNTATTLDQLQASGACVALSQPVALSVLAAVGLTANITAASQVVAMPNPVQNTLRVQFNQWEATHLYLYDMQGRLMLQSELRAGSNSATLNMASLGAGVYQLACVGTGGTQVIKVVKQ